MDDNHFAIVERLKKRVGFAVMNLLDIKRQRMSHMDLIYCQNVLIYFPRMRRYEVLSYLVRCLRPGGFLVLGPGEMANWRHPEMDRVLWSSHLGLPPGCGGNTNYETARRHRFHHL